MKSDFRPLADPSAEALRAGQIALAEHALGRRLRPAELPLVRVCRRTGAVRVAGVRRTVQVLIQHRPDVLFRAPDRRLIAPGWVASPAGLPGRGRPAAPHGPPRAARQIGGGR